MPSPALLWSHPLCLHWPAPAHLLVGGVRPRGQHRETTGRIPSSEPEARPQLQASPHPAWTPAGWLHTPLPASVSSSVTGTRQGCYDHSKGHQGNARRGQHAASLSSTATHSRAFGALIRDKLGEPRPRGRVTCGRPRNQERSRAGPSLGACALSHWALHPSTPTLHTTAGQPGTTLKTAGGPVALGPHLSAEAPQQPREAAGESHEPRSGAQVCQGQGRRCKNPAPP